jgi:hypothetical protein
VVDEHADPLADRDTLERELGAYERERADLAAEIDVFASREVTR